MRVAVCVKRDPVNYQRDDLGSRTALGPVLFAGENRDH